LRIKNASAPRRTVTGAALALAAGVALALPATGMGGIAAVQDDVLTIAPASQIQSRIDLVKSTNAKVSRFDILWSFVAPTQPTNPTDPADPAYNWSRIDQIMKGFKAANITPLVTVYSTPIWAVEGTNTAFSSAYNPNAPRATYYADFMQALATRYNGFYPDAATPGAVLPRLRLIEIWNEPNLKNFFRFNSATSIPKYKQLIKQAYPAIKRGNRNTVVIGGVGGPRSSTGNGNVGARAWLNSLVQKNAPKFDAYSQHIYPSVGPKSKARAAAAFPSWGSLPEIFETLDKKRKGMKLFITEAGYTTAGTSFRNVKVTPSVQNLYLKQMFTLPDVQSPRVAAVVWFNLQDNINWPGGLMFESGVQKPAFATFARIAARPIPPLLRNTLSP
jgi:Glycosyl hydrolases family 39